jgi:hypothetical protein
VSGRRRRRDRARDDAGTAIAVAEPSQDEAIAVGETPVFSERLTAFLESYMAGEAPNAGRFCGNCYSPIARERSECPHCGCSVHERPPVGYIPDEVREMFRRLRGRESLVVNSFAYLGLALAVLIFIVAFAITFSLSGNVWLLALDTLLLFVLARVLAGLLGGWIGDELGHRYAQRKLAEEWQAFAAERG